MNFILPIFNPTEKHIEVLNQFAIHTDVAGNFQIKKHKLKEYKQRIIVAYSGQRISGFAIVSVSDEIVGKLTMVCAKTNNTKTDLTKYADKIFASMGCDYITHKQTEMHIITPNDKKELNGIVPVFSEKQFQGTIHTKKYKWLCKNNVSAPNPECLAMYENGKIVASVCGGQNARKPAQQDIDSFWIKENLQKKPMLELLDYYMICAMLNGKTQIRAEKKTRKIADMLSNKTIGFKRKLNTKRRSIIKS